MLTMLGTKFLIFLIFFNFCATVVVKWFNIGDTLVKHVLNQVYALCSDFQSTLSIGITQV